MPDPIDYAGIMEEAANFIEDEGGEDDAHRLFNRLRAAAASYREEAGKAVYVVFDGPPSHESGRFVETETEDGKGVRVGEWDHHPQSPDLWRLGPLFAVPVGAQKPCPCDSAEPCRPTCTCANPAQSGGCDRCTRYGRQLLDTKLSALREAWASIGADQVIVPRALAAAIEDLLEEGR